MWAVTGRTLRSDERHGPMMHGSAAAPSRNAREGAHPHSVSLSTNNGRVILPPGEGGHPPLPFREAIDGDNN